MLHRSIFDVIHEYSLEAQADRVTKSRHYPMYWNHGKLSVRVPHEEDIGDVESFLDDIDNSIIDSHRAVAVLKDIITEIMVMTGFSAQTFRVPRSSLTHEMNDWLQSDIFMGRVGIVDVHDGYLVIFTDDTDAAHFKLRWG
jgi:hypothetical protein